MVGVAKRQGNIFGESQDNFVYMPIHSFFKMYGSRQWITYVMTARDPSMLESAMDEAKSLIRARRHLTPGQGTISWS